MKKLFLILFLLVSVCANAQPKYLQVDALTTEEGLPSGYVTDFLQDSLGYLWIGTDKGLVRYDGYVMKRYRFSDEFSDQITAVFQDRSLNIWVGTSEQGLLRYDRKKDSFEPVDLGEQAGRKDGTSEKFIQRIAGDAQGGLWVLSGNPQNNMFYLNYLDVRTGKIQKFYSSASANRKLDANKVSRIFVDKKSNVWLGTREGLLWYDRSAGKFSPYANDPASGKNIYGIFQTRSEPDVLWYIAWGTNPAQRVLIRLDEKNNSYKTFNYGHKPGDLPDSVVNRVFEDKTGQLWVTLNSGIAAFDRKSHTFTFYAPGFAPGISNIIEDDNRLFWMNSSKGLLCFNPSTKQFRRYSLSEFSLGYNSRMLKDKAGGIWIPAFDGLGRLNDKASQFEVYDLNGAKQDKQLKQVIYTVLPGSGDEFWIGGPEGLMQWSRYRNELATVNLLKTNKQPGGYAVARIKDRDGWLWCVTPQGLIRYQPGTGRSRFFPDNPNDSATFGMYWMLNDSRGVVWLGGNRCRVSRYNSATGKFIVYSPQFLEKQHVTRDTLDYITSMYEDRSAKLWVGTWKRGLARFDQKNNLLISYGHLHEKLRDVTNIYEDKRGRLWAGCYETGLFLIDRNSFTATRFTEKDGLLSNSVLSIFEDGSGNLWIGSEKGFSILDPLTRQISQVTKAQGLPFTVLTNAQKVNGEEVLVASDKRIAFFRFNEMRLNRVPPKLSIEALRFIIARNVHGKPEDSLLTYYGQKEIHLAHSLNKFSISYTALHFDNPSLNRYAYKLEGYDKDWTYGTERTANYTNLSPGDYVFRVKAANSDGVWTEADQSFHIIIRPPWWRTWWAYASYVLLFVCGMRAYVFYRSRKLQKEKGVLEKRVEERTRELKAAQQQLVHQEKLASLGELTAGIAHEIQNPLNFINNFSELNAELISEMQQEIRQGNNTDALEISAGIKQNLEKISHHGKRADAIVKNMLQHSRKTSGEKDLTDINALVGEYLRLSYHGLRAKEKSFNAIIETHFDPSIGKINVMGQDIGRVLLNLFNNAFYSVSEKKKRNPKDYDPTVQVTTRQNHGHVEISVKDNGTGIPENVREKIYQPFFTTKPTGEGTGLGLSLSYDIITKGHNGELHVETKEGEGAEFLIRLPV